MYTLLLLRPPRIPCFKLRLPSYVDINVALRKLVCLLKPDKEIIHTGDHMIIRTLTSLRNYVMDFDVGVEFEEDLGAVDGRKCQVRVLCNGQRAQ